MNITRVTHEHHISSPTLFKRLSSDIYGPFDLTRFKSGENSDKGYFITITDTCSRLTHLVFTTQIAAENIIKAFSKCFNSYPAPKTIIMNNDTQYVSKEVEDYLESLKIKHTVTPDYHPQSNGISERINAAISEVLAMFPGENIRTLKHWIEGKINMNYNRCILCSPVQMVYRVNEYDPFKRTLDLPTDL
ncbi:hypothetical protein NGRA_3139 [Nosema granulosis]|uniref:Integrase catalytic domain-containing protein n=1 Tax=Nosema granulosis TaxID=83296 RepID=A0A9P6GW19_9MICR|nr:hypothetical protein NGRA_3139 [Nosema granulosis]